MCVTWPFGSVNVSAKPMSRQDQDVSHCVLSGNPPSAFAPHAPSVCDVRQRCRSQAPESAREKDGCQNQHGHQGCCNDENKDEVGQHSEKRPAARFWAVLVQS
jgi:hypothetical protein